MSKQTAGQKAMGWVDARFPATKMWKEHVSEYYAPKNFNFFYYFGSLALLVLVNQIVTGIFLTMFYDVGNPFASVEYIMRDVEWGWLIRYMHSTGASMFFVVIYLHMLRGLMYGSYRGPRELIWVFGCLIFLCLMAEAFMGYVLPWGQMSYWGAQVIVNLFSAIPMVGGELVEWIRGDFLISEATRGRFFALHVIAVPLIILMLVVGHILALHEVGSNNPDGIEIKKVKDENGIPKDGIPFHPYYTVKDIFGTCVFLTLFFAVVFFAPDGPPGMSGLWLEAPNFEEANGLKTPEHIAPVWYFTPYYSMLRAIPDPLGGVLVMGAAVVIMFFLPWLDKAPVKSIRYKGPTHKIMLVLFLICMVVLGKLGIMAPTDERTLLARICTAFYFFFFLAMPFWSKMDKFKDVPERVTYKKH